MSSLIQPAVSMGQGRTIFGKEAEDQAEVPCHKSNRLHSFTMGSPPTTFFFFNGEFGRLIPVSRGRQQCRVLCLLEQLGLALEGLLNTETRVTLFCRGPCTVLSATISKGCGFSSRANSCLVSFAALFSAQAGSRAACFSRDCLSKCVRCSVFMLEKERSKCVL